MQRAKIFVDFFGFDDDIAVSQLYIRSNHQCAPVPLEPENRRAIMPGPVPSPFRRPIPIDPCYGLIATILVSIIAQALGVILGLIAALGKMSKFAAFRWLSEVYIWYFRAHLYWFKCLYYFSD